MRKSKIEVKLSEMAIVKTGLVLSRKAADDDTVAAYEYKQLNLKSIHEDGSIDHDELECFKSAEALSTNYLTKKDDIVVRLTHPHTAVLIQDDTSNIVVSSHFCLIRINTESLLPNYLYWYLNSDIVKSQITKNISSATFIAVKPGFYGDLTLSLPPIPQQKLIGDYFIMSQKENRLLERLREDKLLFNRMVLKKLYRKVVESEWFSNDQTRYD